MTIKNSSIRKGNFTISINQDIRLLTLCDVDPAAHVIARAFQDDPLCTFMLPFKRTRINALVKVFRVIGEINIKNQRLHRYSHPLERRSL
jgi:hypothetical protein